MKKNRILLFVSIFVVAVFSIAANKVYIAPETAVIFDASGTDETINSAAIGQNVVTASSFLDLGSGSRSPDYAVSFITHGWATAPVAGDVITLYLGMGTSTTDFDGSPSPAPTDTGTGTASAAMLPNLLQVVSAVATSTATNAVVRASASVKLLHRYIYAVVENGASGSDNLSSTGVEIVLIPTPFEIQ